MADQAAGVLVTADIVNPRLSPTGSGCKSQDSVGEMSIILRAVPCRTSVFSGHLTTQIPVPNAPTESWNLQPGDTSHDPHPAPRVLETLTRVRALNLEIQMQTGKEVFLFPCLANA